MSIFGPLHSTCHQLKRAQPAPSRGPIRAVVPRLWIMRPFLTLLLPGALAVPSCPIPCSSHGTCSANGAKSAGTPGASASEWVCSCYPGWAGADCSHRECPNGCSGAGACEDGACRCDAASSFGYSFACRRYACPTVITARCTARGLLLPPARLFGCEVGE